MPTYSYRCAACGHEFERVQRITEDAIKTCPSCGADAASRLINSANFILKGSGWYSDLYSGGSNKKSTASGDSAASSASSPSASSTSSSETCAKPGGCDGAGTCATSPSTTSSSTPSTSTN